MDGAPWYVKLAVWLLVWFGFPVFMCIVFLMLIVGYIPSPLTEGVRETKEHRRDTEHMIKFIESTMRVTRQICRNTSPNPVEQLECNR